MSEEQIIQFLQENIDYMVNNDLVLWLFRTIGWYLVKGLSYLIGLDVYKRQVGRGFPSPTVAAKATR